MMTDLASVTVHTPRGAYDVVIGPGAIASLPEKLRDVAPAHRYAVIADDRVAALYGDAVRGACGGPGGPAELLTFPAGESHKSRESWIALSDRMFSAGLGRDSAVVALGGGVTGDLAGFVAATYMRGLPVVQIPTTLLAMIDSSVGGKTGVDTPAGKNLIGAFLQPRIVVADTALLRTLDDPDIRSGLAEAIKHGAIADAAYFREIHASLPAILAREVEPLTPLVLRSVQIKADVVSRDERESGQRKMLNFGHTVGHAVEALSGFRLSHGESIAIGMVVEAEIGERLGVTRHGVRGALEEVLRRAGLPTRVPAEFGTPAILAGTRMDKKARAGRVEYSLIERIGVASAGPTGSWGWAVEDATVSEALAATRA